MHFITRTDVVAAAALLGRSAVRTPILRLPAISSLLSDRLQQTRKVEAFLKCENLQVSGSFKYRGALHSLLKLSTQHLQRGVITHSTGKSCNTFISTGVPGNHALALHTAARNLEERLNVKIPVTIVVAPYIDPEKLKKLRSTSATIVTAQRNNGLAIIEETACIAESIGASYVPPADHTDIVLGQATCFEEFSLQLQAMGLPQVDAVIIPSGGGGLLTGAAIYYKGAGVAVFGAEPVHGGPRLAESIREGILLERLTHVSTIADGLRTSTGRLNWHILQSREYISDVLTTDEDLILRMQQLLLEATGMVVEPSGAVGVAAAAMKENLERISGVCTGQALRLGFVVTGGNAFV